MLESALMSVESGRHIDHSVLFAQINRQRHVREIANPRRVVHHVHPITQWIRRGEIDAVGAADRVVGYISKRLRRGEPIFIEDGSHGDIVLIQSASRRAQRIQVRTLHRFGRMDDQVITINGPRLRGNFLPGPFREDFSLGVSGTRPGQKKGNELELIRITSDGNFSPRPFIIATRKEVLLARVDALNSLSCVWEYQGGANWYISR